MNELPCFIAKGLPFKWPLIFIPNRLGISHSKTLTEVGMWMVESPSSDSSFGDASHHVFRLCWWYTYPSEKYESQMGWLFPIYAKRKVPNDQFFFKKKTKCQSDGYSLIPYKKLAMFNGLYMYIYIYICVCVYFVYIHSIWVKYNISLTWIVRPFGGDSPY